MKRLIYILFVTVLVCGCGTSNVTVTGNVKFEDGSPLTSGSVMLSTDSKSFIGQIDQNGNFSMKTAENKPGIPAGNYTINVSSSPALGEKDLVAESSVKPSNAEIIHGKSTTLELIVRKNE
jgi:hypothetical protein